MPQRNDNRSGRKSQGSNRQQGERRSGSRQHEQNSGGNRQQGEMDRDDEGRFSSNR